MATQVESGPPASARPTGTVTFLFSDIEGSTSRWDSNREQMASALARHDALMRTALEAHGAYIFKTMGDAFCAAFATAPYALAAALEAQRALAAEDFSATNGLRARMALHTGIADERDGDYFGPTVNRIARLLAIGHGGQVLVSAAAAELLHGEMPPRSSLRDLGAHRLKDLGDPEHVYQLVAANLQDVFPALRSVDELPNNLPPQLTTFVGRDDVVANIKTLLEQHRLVTVTGAGGAGKTRCAIQVGAELLDGSGEGVWLVELAPISDPSLLVNAIAQTLNVQEQPNRPIRDTLLVYLKRKRLLLILDNCEHVIDEARQIFSAILHDCSDVHILATSREPLNISGEATYRMPSLAVPSSAAVLVAEGVSRYGAVQLFIDRAILSNNRFTFTEVNAPHVTEICLRLDGIPLAIELAAARVKVLSPQQLARKLDERFRVLTGGDRSALPRQQTMRALIDWSYDLLSNDERALFRKLSIFAGSFTLESAAAVCSEDEMDEIIVLDLLTSLVDKSLVQAEPTGGETRYRLLESTRQYAREKLVQAGESAAAARSHAAAFLARAQQLDDAYESTPDRAWCAQVEPEMENFRTALAWAFAPHSDVLVGQRLVAALRQTWSSFAPAEGRRWVIMAQERTGDGTPAAVAADLEVTEAQLAGKLMQDKASLAAGERAVVRYREIGNTLGTAQAERFVGQALILLGKIADGEALLRQSLAKLRALGARKAASYALATLAQARVIAGDIAEARRGYSEVLSAARAAGAEQCEALVLTNLGETEFRAGDVAAALRLTREARALLRALRDTTKTAVVLCNEAAYLVAQGAYDEARIAAREALAAARDTQSSVATAFALQRLAAVGALRQSADAQALEDRRRGARIVGYADARLAVLEALREYSEQQEYDAIIPALRDALGDNELSKLMAEGSTWSEDQAVAEVMRI